MLKFLYTYIRLQLRFFYLIPLGMIKVLRGRITLNGFIALFEMNKVENRLRLWKSIYLAFRTMPLNLAIRMPVWIYGKTKFFNLSGKMIPLDNTPLYSGMVKIGLMDPARSVGDINSLSITGEVKFGRHVIIRQGAKWKISGSLNIGDNCMIADNVTLFVSTSATFEESCVIAFNTMLMDSDVHYMLDIENMTVKNNCKKILIGRGSWIGNFTMIKKGTKLPPYTIVVGPYSTLSKDYTGSLPDYPMIGGNPARFIKDGLREINNGKMEFYLNDYFASHVEPFRWEGNIEELCSRRY